MFSQAQKTAIFFACVILTIGLMAMDFINPSLPYLVRGLSTNQSSVQQLIVCYMIGLGVSQFFYGTFSDNYGRKLTISIAYVISTCGILLSANVHSIEMFCVCRFITGFGSGGSTMVARAIISDSCHDQVTIKKAFSWFSISSQVSPSVAPIIGGFVQQYTGSWRACFVTLAVITFLALLVIRLFMPETYNIPKDKKSFAHQVMVYISLFRLRKFMSFNFISALIYVFTIGYYCYMPFILVKLNFTPIENGAIYSVYAAFLILGSLSLGKYLNRINSKVLFSFCCGGYMLNSVAFFIYFNNISASSTAVIIIFSAVLSFLCGIAAPLTLALCLTGFNQDKGAASAVQSFVKMFFTGVALFIFNFIPLHSVVSLLKCNIILSMGIIIIFVAELRLEDRAST